MNDLYAKDGPLLALPFAYEFNPESAAVLLELAHERKLTLFDINFVARMAFGYGFSVYEEFLRQINAAHRYVGEDENAFHRFLLLVAQNRNLTSAESIASALELSKKSNKSIMRFVSDTVFSLATGRRSTKVTEHSLDRVDVFKTLRIDWDILRASLAFLDYAMQTKLLYQPHLKLIENLRPSSIPSVAMQLKEAVESRLFSQGTTIKDMEKSKAAQAGLVRYEFLDATLKALSNSFDEMENELWYNIIDRNIHLHMRSLSVVGSFIDSRPYIVKKEVLREILKESFRDAFLKVDFPEHRQAAFIDTVADALLRHKEVFATPLQERVASLPLPDAAPEIYQGLRGPETPPAFVQRVYGPWLGHGLDRGHIRQLDPTLYQAIINWARRNEWPAEVDLPTRAENNSRLIEAVERDGPAALSIQGPHSLKALASLESARRRRTNGRE